MGDRRFSALAALAGVLLLSGCMPATSTPTATPGSSASTSGTPAPTPSAAPVYVAGGSAQKNLAYFDLVNNRLFTSNGGANGRTIIDNLVAAGFTKADMQVTPDKTTINDAVDSILFSVRFGTECLLGQHGGGGYTSSVQSALAGGACIVGRTRAIDW